MFHLDKIVSFCPVLVWLFTDLPLIGEALQWNERFWCENIKIRHHVNAIRSLFCAGGDSDLEYCFVFLNIKYIIL